jgi:hypothetical protein
LREIDVDQGLGLMEPNVELLIWTDYPSSVLFWYIFNCYLFVSLFICTYLYSGFPSLGVLLQKMENPALSECLKVSDHEVYMLINLKGNVYWVPWYKPAIWETYYLLCNWFDLTQFNTNIWNTNPCCKDFMCCLFMFTF